MPNSSSMDYSRLPTNSPLTSGFAVLVITSWCLVRRGASSHTLTGTKRGGLAVTRLYVAGGNAVSVVENGSVETGLDGRGARCLAFDPQDPDTLYVGTTDEG